MTKLRVHNFLVSLDGYATGEGQRKTAGFGHAQREFLDWFERLRNWRGLIDDGKLGPDEAIASAWGSGIGAEIMGRNKFRPTTGPWPEDGWPGWWSDHAPFHTPCFVMTHYPREPVVAGDTTFRFVSGSPAEVLAMASDAACGLGSAVGWRSRRRFRLTVQVGRSHVVDDRLVIDTYGSSVLPAGTGFAV